MCIIVALPPLDTTSQPVSGHLDIGLRSLSSSRPIASNHCLLSLCCEGLLPICSCYFYRRAFHRYRDYRIINCSIASVRTSLNLSDDHSSQCCLIDCSLLPDCQERARALATQQRRGGCSGFRVQLLGELGHVFRSFISVVQYCCFSTFPRSLSLCSNFALLALCICLYLSRSRRSVSLSLSLSLLLARSLSV